jgi:pyrroline-5-carboxylate reductase
VRRPPFPSAAKARHKARSFDESLLATALEGARIAFVGAGAMAEAMISGLLANNLVDPAAIVASHHREQRIAELTSTLGIGATTDNRAAVEHAQVVVLSVKPQVLTTIFKELRGVISPSALVLSIVAGARIESIARGLGHKAIVRSMPNTPAQVGEGMTVWTATAAVSKRQQAQAAAILRALGHELFIEAEAFLDMATAISGTGPTYVFLLMEALIDAAVHLGFSRADAREIVVQTVKGSAIFVERSSMHPAEMRNMVTSPGGTSAEALYQLEKGGFRTVLSKAVWSAYQRSVSLGTLDGKVPPLEPDENHTSSS